MRYLNEEELHIARRFLFLSMAITVLQKDIQTIKDGHFKIKEPYINLLENMVSHALDERRKLRDNMQMYKIKVVKLNQNESFTSFLFLCDKREEQRNYFNPAIRKKVEAIIYHLLQNARLPD